MASLSFYRQQRVDGGVRTGIELDEATLLGRYELGEGEEDPILLWVIDLRCEGEELPVTDSAGARAWFLKNRLIFVSALEQLADTLKPGIDPDDSVLYPVASPWPGLRILIAVSCSRRLAGYAMAEHLREFGQHWEEILTGLQEPILL